ncbi:DUF433 domain-containing protein [Flavobacterium nackdongense]|uniref:DUF433 domain-containing protein n=1 Tax=Flavobacterium nackdongense TaxID=2547394 RepID=A0A4P6YGA9_9FLAO|nr:DUF433 domain-containing protein [Flavobacterium nackdongense]QBN19590.1 DUF433 domain-containing protein [Flavobacterium nackdongense]
MEFIEINPKIMIGKPVIKGTRITVEQIISMLAQGISIDEILEEYKGLTKPEVLACLQYAEKILEKTTTLDLDKIAS